jgi:hypothetical protein
MDETQNIEESVNTTQIKPIDPKNRFRLMSPENKLELSLRLYYSARELKQSWLKLQHPDWSEAIVEKWVREIFLYART